MSVKLHRHPIITVTLLLALVLLAGLSGLAAPPPATAAVNVNGPPLHVTLLGDSYSAGNGAGNYYGPKDSLRSRNNWAHQYVEWLNSQGAPTTLTNLAHSGDVTTHLTEGGNGRPSQISQIPTDTDLVMFTIGGNDVSFSDIVTQCFALGFRDPTGCQQSVDNANSKLDDVMASTTEILQGIDSHLPDGARVVLVGYPRLATDRHYVLKTINPFDETEYDAGTNVRALSDTARTKQADLVSTWNASHPSLQVTYIDGVVDAFDGHEPDPSTTNRNPYRWINEFFETEGQRSEDGTTASTRTSASDNLHWYHPNLIGHEEIARLIEEEVGIPSPVQTGEDQLTGDIDIAFVVDSTGSMEDDVSAVRANVSSIVESVRSKSSTYRFALVDYKDHPQHDSQNYLARTDVNFTTDTAAIEAGLASLTFVGGNVGNTNASVYSGIMQALNLQWRDGVKKIVVVLGDAPPRDPEPGTGYTADSVADAAYAVDPVSVYGINTGGTLDSPDFTALVDTSGGTSANAASPDEVTALINQAVDTALSTPFAWIQGPYVIKVGDTLTLDARGSYATSGSITSYEWDFNGDGVYEQTTTEGMVTHTFTEEFDGYAGVRVTQSDGKSAVGSTPLMVSDDGDSTPREEDNCPDIENYSQSDEDGDGIGDDCDPDAGDYPTADKPGVCVVGENCPGDPGATPVPSPSQGSAPAPTGPGAPSPTAAPTASANTSTTTVSRAPASGRGLLGNTGANGAMTAAAALALVACGALLHLRRQRD